MGHSNWYQEKMRTAFSGGSMEQYSVKEENQEKMVCLESVWRKSFKK